MDAAPAQRSRDEKPAVRDFWGEYLALTVTVAAAAEGVVFRRSESGPWEVAPTTPLAEGLEVFGRGVLDDLAAAAVRADDAFAAYPDDFAPRGHLLAFLAERGAASVAVLVLRVTCTSAEAARDALRRAKAVRAVAGLLRSKEEAAQNAERVAQFAAVLDLLTLLHAESHFHSAAMLLCHEIAARFRAERASLGWRRGGGVQLRAISHAERFERKMNVVSALESAMEEALEQDDEILFPAPPASILVTRDHQRFAELERVAHLVTVPLRASSGVTGALTIERAARPFEEAELQTLRLFGDHVGALLDDLERRSRWFGARWLAALREAAARLLGFDHTWLKLTAVGGCLLLAALATITKSYRVEAPFILKSDQEAQLPAPFDGYLSKVLVRPGDAVAEGAPLAELDTRELQLEEAAAAAEQTHHLSEASQARSDNKLSDMLIAQAGAARAKARLDLARYHLSQAAIAAPIAGAVVEGDLREKIGAPVKQGDVLLKVVDLSQLHVEADIPERDLAACLTAQGGELSFASRPRERAAFRLERIEPVAETRDKGNVFVARALPVAPPESWWRPGMTGVCKIDAGRHSLLWIITHRTVDFFHTLLWW